MALQWFCSSPVPERQLLIQIYGLAEMLTVWPSAQYKCWSVKHCLSLYIENKLTKQTTHTKLRQNKQKPTVNQNWLIFLRIYLLFFKRTDCQFIFSIFINMPKDAAYLYSAFLHALLNCARIFSVSWIRASTFGSLDVYNFLWTLAVSDHCFCGINMLLFNSFLFNMLVI